MDPAKRPAVHGTAPPPTAKNDLVPYVSNVVVEKAWHRARYHKSEKARVYKRSSTRFTNELIETSFLPPNPT